MLYTSELYAQLIHWIDAHDYRSIAQFILNDKNVKNAKNPNNSNLNPMFTNEVLLDDRNERSGVMFKDHELIGIPHRIVINEKILSTNMVEYKSRKQPDIKIMPLADIIELINNHPK
jgi:prolyl-tRNA synthetase